jgi:hypothetical protein
LKIESALDPADYCREIEAYLCRKNDGHLIRVVGPSFELVSQWAVTGVPLSIACHGIDRYFERYYRKAPRRRPVRIDFCEADVLDAFDEWRRAVGLRAVTGEAAPPAGEPGEEGGEPARSGAGKSVPAHLERALLRLTDARATGSLGESADALIDRLGQELERARASRGGVRGDARAALMARLTAIDCELLTLARQSVSKEVQQQLQKEAAVEIQPFRSAMGETRYQQAVQSATDHLLRSRLGLPTVSLS